MKLRLELLIATHNIGKLRELQQALGELPITLRYLHDFPHISTIDETGGTYEQNAILKAMGYAEQTGLYALADDSGLEVDVLGGKPGVFSARFGGEDASDQDRNQKLLRELRPYRHEERAARFICCMAFAGESSRPKSQNNPLQVLNVSDAVCEGTIAFECSGTDGFGYDPIFIPNGHKETFAELPREVKAAISHRGKALASTRTFLTQFLKAT